MVCIDSNQKLGLGRRKMSLKNLAWPQITIFIKLRLRRSREAASFAVSSHEVIAAKEIDHVVDHVARVIADLNGVRFRQKDRREETNARRVVPIHTRK